LCCHSNGRCFSSAPDTWDEIKDEQITVTRYRIINSANQATSIDENASSEITQQVCIYFVDNPWYVCSPQLVDCRSIDEILANPFLYVTVMIPNNQTLQNASAQVIGDFKPPPDRRSKLTNNSEFFLCVQIGIFEVFALSNNQHCSKFPCVQQSS